MAPQILTPDHLLRRIRMPDHIKKQKVGPGAFKGDRNDVGHGLSLTKCDHMLTEQDVDNYQEKCCQHPAGILGVCFVTVSQITLERLSLASEPNDDPDPFGQDHVLLTDGSDASMLPGKDQRRQLARDATANGHFRAFEPNAAE